MSYEFHVFLSYRRYGQWPRWVKETFLPKFEHWLGEELGENARVFCDQSLDSGSSWPGRLGAALARSCVLVPLWSRQYFSSEWCRAELAHMRAREEQCGFRTPQRPEGLIIPAQIHDGQDLPQSVRDITAFQLQDCVNICVAKDSPLEEELSGRLRDWVPDIAAAIRRAPAYDTGWNTLAIDRFVELFQMLPPAQVHPPRLSTP